MLQRHWGSFEMGLNELSLMLLIGAWFGCSSQDDSSSGHVISKKRYDGAL